MSEALDRITARIREALAERDLPEKCVAVDFGPDGVVRVDARQSPMEIGNEDGDCDCRLRVSMDDFKRLAKGELDPMKAMMRRKIRIDGDFGLAFRLAQALKKGHAAP
ncbi:MAG: SCP2 sterol-binding domain-containing protein [Maricaulaceae bacterium]